MPMMNSFYFCLVVEELPLDNLLHFKTSKNSDRNPIFTNTGEAHGMTR